jgi:hypothetical protein
MTSGTLKASGEIYRLSFPFVDLYVPALIPRLQRSEAELQFADNTTFMVLGHVNTGIVSEQSKMSSRCGGGIVYIVACRPVAK